MDRTPESERAALEDLLQSEGWAIFTAHMGAAWGPEAYERQIDAALDGAPTDDEPAITRRIRDTFKGVRASLKWPEERVRTLKDAKAQEPQGFERFMRRPKRA